MSNKIIKQPHPLRRNGSTRVERMLRALTPDHFRLDDRSMQDLLVTAHRYSRMLSWFDFDDRPDGNWTCFWETETLTYLAVLAAIDLEQLRKDYDDADYKLGVILESSGGDPVKKSQLEQEAYLRLMEILFSMAQGLEERYRKLVAIRHPLQTLLLGLIKRNNVRDTEEIEGALSQLIVLHKGKDDDLDPHKYDVFIHPDNRWGMAARGDYGRKMAEAPADYPREQLRSVFLRFYNTYVVLQNSAQRAFNQELARMEKPESEEYRIVQPHISLFIAFLRLFRHAQDSLNELVGKQLNFYYEKVLALHRAPAQADSVYLIFNLAKNFEPQLVEKGAQLFGGKDASGRPLIYETVRDWVVGQAQIAELKSFYIPSGIYTFNYDTSAEFSENAKTLIGKKHELPLGDTGIRGFSDDIDYEEQEVGFVIASPQLLLQEGKRLIEIRITNVLAALTTEIVNVFLSGKEGWSTSPIVVGDLDTYAINAPIPPIPLPSPTFDFGIDDANVLTLKIFLPKDFPPVVPIENNPMTKWPAVKITLKKDKLQDIGADYNNLVAAFTDNNGDPINKEFTIGVRAEEVSKNLIMQTDQGVFNGTQQVMPFGPTAPKGARFYVGFSEAFLKKINQTILNINWVGASDINYSNYPPGLSGSTFVEFLHENKFKEPINLDVDDVMYADFLPSGNSMVPSIPITFSNSLDRGDSNYKFEQYDPSIRRGFLRFTFNGELFHTEYAKILAKKSIEFSEGTSSDSQQLDAIRLALEEGTADAATIQAILDGLYSPDIPNPPYTPTFNSIELTYYSEGQNMEDDVDEFYYLHPFEGYERASLIPQNNGQEPVYSFNDVTLFKDFIESKEQRGHLYIGLSQLKPGSNLSMLVQTAEGSEKKTDVDAPLLQWACLTENNTWKNVPADKVLLDSTRGLTRSGIIQLAIPDEISSAGNTILNPKLLWLRVTTLEKTSNPIRQTAALPDLTYLHAQVIEARFRDINDNDYGHLAEGLPAKTISKLALSRSAIKKIEQPLSSFGGRLPETEGMAFYLRISERLRHRDRAVTVWDYEHLLLEAYPDIAAAKCIPHTQYQITPASELAPGQVVVAVVPDLQKRAGASREQPRFPKGDLDDMRDFLLARACPFLSGDQFLGKDNLTLFVINAQYEPIEVTINVKFREGVDEAFFQLQLDKDLHYFLSPWLNGGAPPAFGQTIRRSQIIQFVEELYYIDYVDVDVNDAVNAADDDLVFKKDNEVLSGEYIRPGAAHGILCSASKHNVSKIT